MENSTTNQNNVSDIISENTEKSQESTNNITQAAIEKIQKEFADFKGGNKETAVSSYVSTIIQDFCKQDMRFAEVVYKFKRTLSDCCKDIMKGAGAHISDIDVYRSAVQFYFPNSEINMNMTISITGEAPPEEEISKEAPKPEPKKAAKKADKKPKATAKKPKHTDTKKEDEFVPIQLSLF